MRNGVQGQSYIMMARFGKGLPQLETINVYGANNRPDSPHYNDQMSLYLQHKLRPMTLDKEKVLKSADAVYHQGDH